VLDGAKTPRTYRAGEVLFYDGTPSLGLFCVQRGTVALRRPRPSGKPALVHLVEAGQTFGYRALFAGEHHGTSAQALTECRVCFVDRRTVLQLLERDAALCWRFMRSLAHDSERAEDALVRSNSLDLRTRLVHLLLSLKAAHGQVDDEGNIVLELPLSREDMASLIGARPESLSRAIRALEAAGIARFIGRKVIVADLDLLIDELEPGTARPDPPSAEG
jgi:CRP-like cAMP-binding protein